MVRFKNLRLITSIFALIFIVASFLSFINPQPFLQFGYLGVLVYSFFGTGTVLVPVFSRYLNVFLLSAVSALGMALNDSVSWYVGNTGQVVLPPGKSILRFEKQVKKYGPWALFFWALIPFPYDIIAIIAGYLRLPYFRFLIPMFLGRLVRFLLLGSGSVALWGKVL